MSIRRKVMLLGDIGVGKTSLIRRLVLDRFDINYRSTLGYDIYKFDIDGVGPKAEETCELLIWDTDGNLGTNIFRQKVQTDGAAGALIVGDITRPETHDLVIALAGAFEEHLPGRRLAIVMNKSDLAPDAEIPARIKALRHPIETTSARTGHNVRESFRSLANAIVRSGV